jgi:hypothetical protein
MSNNQEIPSHQQEQVDNMLSYIKSQEGLSEFVANFNDKNGFMWSDDKRVNQIGNAVIEDGHSGASFALCLRMCQSILNKELNNRK